ncbi:MAG: hypothetical protein AAB252_07325, partial [Pseudomonadota bacterium]
SATGASLHRGPRLDPIGESATGASLHRGPRLDPIGEEKFADIRQACVGWFWPSVDIQVLRTDHPE